MFAFQELYWRTCEHGQFWLLLPLTADICGFTRCVYKSKTTVAACSTYCVYDRITCGVMMRLKIMTSYFWQSTIVLTLKGYTLWLLEGLESFYACVSVGAFESVLYTCLFSWKKKKNGLEKILCSLVCCIWRFFFVIFVSVSLPVFPCPPALFVPPPPPTCYLLINVICFQQPPVELLFDIPAANQLDVMDTFFFCFKWLS